MRQLEIHGQASKKIVKVIVVEDADLKKNLMDFLTHHGIPVASSCKGEGVCQKCKFITQERLLLSCQLIVSDIFPNKDNHEDNDQILAFSYL